MGNYVMEFAHYSFRSNIQKQRHHQMKQVKDAKITAQQEKRLVIAQNLESGMIWGFSCTTIVVQVFTGWENFSWNGVTLYPKPLDTIEGWYIVWAAGTLLVPAVWFSWRCCWKPFQDESFEGEDESWDVMSPNTDEGLQKMDFKEPGKTKSPTRVGPKQDRGMQTHDISKGKPVT